MNKDTIETSREALIKDVVMIAARILLESGAEGTRVEDTMARIATKLGYPESNSFVTNTVIEFVYIMKHILGCIELKLEIRT